MSQSITALMSLRCIRDAAGDEGGYVTVRFSYDPSDPFVVGMYFVREDVPWEFSRDLLDGIDQPTGCGDIRVRPVDRRWVSIHLSPPEGEATFHAPREALAEFRARTHRAVKPGRERMDLDAAVLKLLGSSR